MRKSLSRSLRGRLSVSGRRGSELLSGMQFVCPAYAKQLLVAIAPRESSPSQCGSTVFPRPECMETLGSSKREDDSATVTFSREVPCTGPKAAPRGLKLSVRKERMAPGQGQVDVAA